MKIPRTLLGVALGAAAATLLAQSETTAQTTTRTETSTQTTVTATGEVVRYDAGKTIVVRSADGRTTTYTIAPDVAVPAEVTLGKTVTITSESGEAGSARATRIEIAASPAGATAVNPTDGSRPSGEAVLAAGASEKIQKDAIETAGGIVSGEVVRYEAGKSVVIRDASGRETTYTLTTATVVPAEVRVGRRVSITTEPTDSGSAIVTRITTESVLPDGSRKTTTESTYRAPSAAGSEAAAAVTGTVSAYEPGQSITIARPDKTTVTYSIDRQSQLPSDVAVGKQVTVQTRTVTTTSSPVVRRVVYTTRTKTTTKKTSEQ